MRTATPLGRIRLCTTSVHRLFFSMILKFYTSLVCDDHITFNVILTQTDLSKLQKKISGVLEKSVSILQERSVCP